MTLQNGLVHGDTAFLWADTAFVDTTTGKVVALDSKAFHGLLWPFAGTLSTIGGNPHDIAEEIGRSYPLNLADLLDCTAKALRRYCKAGFTARALLAAYEDGPRLFMIGSDQWHPDVAPFESAELESFTSSGNRLAPYLLAQAVGWTPERMLAQIEGQRAEAFGNPEAGVSAMHGIGGNCVEMAVTRSGVTSRVVRGWGDAVGERIEPGRSCSIQRQSFFVASSPPQSLQNLISS